MYVRHDRHNRGIGSALLTDLIARAAAVGHHTIIAGIDAEQMTSVRLHEKFGFKPIGTFTAVGRKFDKYWDVAWFERPLRADRDGNARVPR